MTSSLLFRVAIAGAAAIATAVPAQATPAEGEVVRTDLASGTTDSPIAIVTTGPSTLSVQQLRLKPGAGSGWHSHPGTEYSVVSEGTLELQFAGSCEVRQVGAGRAVFIPAGVIHRVDNDTALDAVAVVTYTLPKDAAARIDAVAACPG
jgi:quercetin dioxygenase-like cupin family protein